jgi:murein L,D-transpeptidase YcbB/YkuD
MYYDADPEDTAKLTHDLVDSITTLYGDLADPLELADMIYTPTPTKFNSNNFKGPERVEQEYQNNKEQQSKEKLISNTEKFTYSKQYLKQLPDEYQNFIKEELKSGRDFESVAKELQRYVGVKADGYIGPKTVHALKTIKPLPGKEELVDYEKEVAPSSNVVDTVFNTLAGTEGRGDNVTDTPTGNLGMTAKTKQLLEKKYGRSMSDEEAAKMYIKDLEQSALAVNKDIPSNLLTSFVATTYNTGFNPDWESYNKFLKNPSDDTLKDAMLTKIYAGGKSMIGIAARRAHDYNLSNPPKKIVSVRQKDNGDIEYLDSNNNVVFYVNSTRPKHSASKSTELKVRGV